MRAKLLFKNPAAGRQAIFHAALPQQRKEERVVLSRECRSFDLARAILGIFSGIGQSGIVKRQAEADPAKQVGCQRRARLEVSQALVGLVAKTDARQFHCETAPSSRSRATSNGMTTPLPRSPIVVEVEAGRCALSSFQKYPSMICVLCSAG